MGIWWDCGLGLGLGLGLEPAGLGPPGWTAGLGLRGSLAGSAGWASGLEPTASCRASFPGLPRGVPAGLDCRTGAYRAGTSGLDAARLPD